MIFLLTVSYWQSNGRASSLIHIQPPRLSTRVTIFGTDHSCAELYCPHYTIHSLKVQENGRFGLLRSMRLCRKVDEFD